MPQGRKTSLVVELTPDERQTLESWQRSTTIRAGLYRRGRIILMLADGASISYVARAMGVRRFSVYKWAWRFAEKRLAGLEDGPGRGKSPRSPGGEAVEPVAGPAPKVLLACSDQGSAAGQLKVGVQ